MTETEEINSTEQKIEDVIEEISQDYKKIDLSDMRTTMSSFIGNIAGALAKAQGTMEGPTKDKAGYGYKYMTLNNLIDTIKGPLSENEIAFIQTHYLKKGSTPSVVTETILAHESGEWIKSSLEIPILVMKQLSPAQMAGVAATYGRRYALQAMTGIAADEDNDATAKTK